MKHDNRRKGMSDRMAWLRRVHRPRRLCRLRKDDRTDVTGKSDDRFFALDRQIHQNRRDRKIQIGLSIRTIILTVTRQLFLFTHFGKPLLYSTEYIFSSFLIIRFDNRMLRNYSQNEKINIKIDDAEYKNKNEELFITIIVQSF